MPSKVAACSRESHWSEAIGKSTWTAPASSVADFSARYHAWSAFSPLKFNTVLMWRSRIVLASDLPESCADR